MYRDDRSTYQTIGTERAIGRRSSRFDLHFIPLLEIRSGGKGVGNPGGGEEWGERTRETVAYQRYCSKALNRGLSCWLEVHPLHPHHVPVRPFLRRGNRRRHRHCSTIWSPRGCHQDLAPFFCGELARIKADSLRVMLLKRYRYPCRVFHDTTIK